MASAQEGRKNSGEEAAVAAENGQSAIGTTSSCWKKKEKSEDATFVEGLRDRWDHFKNASMDDRKACFKNTFQNGWNAFGVSNITGKKHNSEAKTDD